MRVSLVAIDDRELPFELAACGAAVREGQPARESDAIFFGPATAKDLARLKTLKRFLKPDGAIWVLRQRGRPGITESGVMAAGKTAGLVDVKVVRFSETHTAEKFVIPVARRHRDRS